MGLTLRSSPGFSFEYLRSSPSTQTENDINLIKPVIIFPFLMVHFRVWPDKEGYVSRQDIPPSFISLILSWKTWAEAIPKCLTSLFARMLWIQWNESLALATLITEKSGVRIQIHWILMSKESYPKLHTKLMLSEKIKYKYNFLYSNNYIFDTMKSTECVS